MSWNTNMDHPLWVSPEQQQRQEWNSSIPIGSRVRIKLDAGRDIKRAWERYETRGYMIVTGYGNRGYLKFDNQDFTRAGGAWNPNQFEVFTQDNFSSEEDLFTV